MGNSNEINFKDELNQNIQRITDLLHCLRMTSASRNARFEHDVKRAEGALIDVIKERMQDLRWEVFEADRVGKETRAERRRRAEHRRDEAASVRKWQREERQRQRASEGPRRLADAAWFKEPGEPR